MLWVVACVLAVVCKRMQQLPARLGPAVYRENDTSHTTLEIMCIWACVAPTMLDEQCKRIQPCCATLRRSRNKRNIGSCWRKRLTGFKIYATTPNTDATPCNRVCKRRKHITSNNVASVCTCTYTWRNSKWRQKVLMQANKKKTCWKGHCWVPQDKQVCHKISKIRSCVVLISTATTSIRVAERFVIGFMYVTKFM